MSSSVVSFVSHWFHNAISTATTIQQPGSDRCTQEEDSRFGPTVRRCRSQFDFTLYFEEWILTILPSIVFIVLALARGCHLRRQRDVVRAGWPRTAKLVRLQHQPIGVAILLRVPKGSCHCFDGFTSSYPGRAMPRSWHPYGCDYTGCQPGPRCSSPNLCTQLLQPPEIMAPVFITSRISLPDNFIRDCQVQDVLVDGRPTYRWVGYHLLCGHSAPIRSRGFE